MSVGVKQFDKDHARLFELLNRLYTASTYDNHTVNLESIVDELISYANHHFIAEELVLKKSGYPDLPAQEMEHEQFVFRVLEFKRDLINGNKTPTSNMIWFLGNWLLHHIMEVDKKYTAHLSKMEISHLNH
jgi:hemerythrin-like metal-binding protein